MSIQQKSLSTHEKPNDSVYHDEESAVRAIMNHSFNKFDNNEASFTKENTHQATLEDILKQTKQALEQRKKLKGYLENVKNQAIKTNLKDFMEALTKVGKQNEQLRCQYKKISKTCVRMVSPHHTPRSRKSLNISASNLNVRNPNMKSSFVQSGSSTKRDNKENLRKSIQNKVCFSKNAFFDNEINFEDFSQFGRSSLPLRRPLRDMRANENTKRKLLTEMQCNLFEDSFCRSQFVAQNSQQFQSRITTKTFQQEESTDFNGPNIFLQFIETIVQKEKQIEQENIQQVATQSMQQAYSKFSNTDHNEAASVLKSLKTKIEETQDKTAKLENIYKSYITQIKNMNEDINICNENVFQLHKSKEKDIRLKSDFQKKTVIKEQFELKSKLYQNLVGKRKNQSLNLPESLKVMVKILTGKSCKQNHELLQLVKQSVKNPAKFKQDNKKTEEKVTQLKNSMEEGRNKFKQLIQIYNGRIRKLENKLSDLNKKGKQAEGASKTFR